VHQTAPAVAAIPGLPTDIPGIIDAAIGAIADFLDAKYPGGEFNGLELLAACV
jgi:hypothetical protein